MLSGVTHVETVWDRLPLDHLIEGVLASWLRHHYTLDYRDERAHDLLAAFKADEVELVAHHPHHGSPSDGGCHVDRVVRSAHLQGINDRLQAAREAQWAEERNTVDTTPRRRMDGRLVARKKEKMERARVWKPRR